MQEKITCRVIGDLFQEGEFKHHWNGEDVPVSFFDNHKIPVSIIGLSPTDPNFLKDADEALSHFFEKNKQDRLEIAP